MTNLPSLNNSYIFHLFQTESPIFPSSSISMQSPIQSSLSSPSQDHGYCSNTNGNNNERQILEKNLERLISERGMEVIGQLTKEMSPQQIERLLIQTKQKLQATNSAPLGSGAVPNNHGSGSHQDEARSSGRKSLKGATSGHRGSMTEVYHKHSSSDEDEDNLSNNMSRKGGLTKQRSSAVNNGSAKNLSVRFDPSQVQTSPHMEHHNMGRRGHHKSGHKQGHHHHHRSRRAVSRQPERANYYHHQPMIPRSHSYSGQAGLQESLAQMGHAQPAPPNMLARHQSPHVGRRPPMMNYYSNYHPHQGFVMEEDDDVCSTCSSSSSDSDDPYAYQLPPRKAYGGVRLSYVPNDRIRAGRHVHQRSLQGSHQEYVSQRHSLRGASIQPQSLPPNRQAAQQQLLPPQQPQTQQQQQQPHQFQQHQSAMQQFAHPGPASGSSISSSNKDKDKCIIS